MQDYKIVVYEARKRTDKEWKEKHYTIREFSDRLKTPLVGKETQDEYFNLSREEQNEKKDVGGFTGSILENGKRNKESIKAKTLLALDIDNAPTDIIEQINQVYKSYYYFIYTTRKHTKQAPRLRLIFLLKEHCDTVEYEAMGRKVASFLGLSFFDATTFQPSRFMYWPSISKGADFIFKENKGQILDPKSILKLYQDYKSIEEWPQFEEEKKKTKKLFKDIELEDQLLKPGLVGIYNRHHPISSVLLHELADYYEPSKLWDNVFTYKGASSVDGIKILKEDTIYYSFHSSDPNNGEALNAFDLVRRVKFGHLDQETHKKTNIKYYPSFKAMSEYVLADKLCQKELDLLENEKDKKGDSDYTNNILQCRHYMKANCQKNPKGACVISPYNLSILLRNDKNISNVGYFDVFNSQYIKSLDLPWLKTYKKNKLEIPTQWSETDTTYLQQYIGKYYGFNYSLTDINNAVRVLFHERQINSVYEYLKGLKWDGKKRLEFLLIDYLGADNTEEIKETTKNHFVAAVARACQLREEEADGVYYPYCLFLIGSQGLGKTSLLQALTYKASLYLDLQAKLDDKNTFEILRGKWLVELGESSSLTKSEASIIKQSISKTADEYRKAYGRDVENIKRRFVFFGTSNTINILNDNTGNRRFLIVEGDKEKQKKQGYKMSPQERDQIWAEAFYYYMQGLDYNKFETSTLQYLEEQQVRANKKPEYLEEVEEYASRRVPECFYDWDIERRRAFYKIKEEDFYNSDFNFMYSYQGNTTRKTRILESDWLEFAKYRERISTYEFINEFLAVDINDNYALRNFQKREIKKAFVYLSNFEPNFLYNYDEKVRYYNPLNCIKYPQEKGVLFLDLKRLKK